MHANADDIAMEEVKHVPDCESSHANYGVSISSVM